jgi:hypothetical protein
MFVLQLELDHWNMCIQLACQLSIEIARGFNLYELHLKRLFEIVLCCVFLWQGVSHALHSPLMAMTNAISGA